MTRDVESPLPPPFRMFRPHPISRRATGEDTVGEGMKRFSARGPGARVTSESGGLAGSVDQYRRNEGFVVLSALFSCGSKVLTFSHMLGNHCFRFSLKPAQFPDGMHNHKQIHYVSCTRPLEYDELLLLMIDTGFRRNPDSRWSVSLAGLR